MAKDKVSESRWFKKLPQPVKHKTSSTFWWGGGVRWSEEGVTVGTPLEILRGRKKQSTLIEKLKIAKMKLGVRPWKGGSSKWLWSIASFTLWQIHETQAAKCNLTQASLSPPAPAYRQDSLQKPQWYLLALQLQPLAEKKNSLENCNYEELFSFSETMCLHLDVPIGKVWDIDLHKELERWSRESGWIEK